MIRHVPCGRCMPTASCRAVACSLTRAAPHTPGKLNWPCCCRRSRCLRRPVILRPPSPPCALATTSLGRAELVSRAMASTSPAGVPAAARPRARTAATRTATERGRPSLSVCKWEFPLNQRHLAAQRRGTFATNGRAPCCDAVQRSAVPLDRADVERVVPKVHRLDLRSSEHFRKLPTRTRHGCSAERIDRVPRGPTTVRKAHACSAGCPRTARAENPKP